MLLLPDGNFPKGMVDMLRAQGNDVVWARTDCCGWKDAALLDFAESGARIILTLDKDFWQIAVQRRVPLKQAVLCCFEFILRLLKISGRLCVYLSKRLGTGRDTSVSLPATESKC